MRKEYVILEVNEYNQLTADVSFIKTEVAKLREALGGRVNNSDEWISPVEARELLGVGRTKFFQMKSQGVFKFSQFGRKSKISRKSLESFLKQNVMS